MKEQAIEVFEAEGTEAAIAFLQQTKADLPLVEHVQLFSDVMRHAYWEKKDLAATLQLGQAGITFGEKLLGKHPDQGEDIKGKVKGLCYDIASFAWPGWNEKGITVTPNQVQLGLEAAKRNLQLAQELKKDPLPCSRAHWMLAAQEIAAGEYDQARHNFEQAEKLARQAEAEDEALLSAGFVVVVELLQKPGDEALKAKLENIRAALRPMEHGKFFIAQLFDSLKLFGK